MFANQNEKKHQFKDRAWDVKHARTGESLGWLSVNGDSVREAFEHNPHRTPSGLEDELFSDALERFCYNHKLDPEDLDVSEAVDGE